MQDITESEIQREVRALRSHRRISVNRPVLDPDLPDMALTRSGGRELLHADDSASTSSSSNSTSSGYLGSGTPPKPSWGGVSLNDDGPMAHDEKNGPSTGSLRGARPTFSARRRATAEGQDASSSSQRLQSTSSTSSQSSSSPLDPSHLFWVPASMHPEISPSDFRKFLSEHASRAVRDSNERRQSTDLHSPPVSPTSPTTPTSSGASPVDLLRNRSTSIARRGSTLRRQYRPENDNEDDSTPGPSRGVARTASQRPIGYGANAPELSVDDLQKLEKLAEEASQSSDPTELRSVLRRTMSLNVAPSALDQVDALPQESEQDAPLVPRPGQILRRAARTKIRKSSFSGAENIGTGPGGSRLGPRRRQTAALATSSTSRPDSGELEHESQDGDVSFATTEGEDRRQSATSSDSHLGLGGLAPMTTSSQAPGHRGNRHGSDAAIDSDLETYPRHSLVSDETHRTSLTSVTDTASKHTSVHDDHDGMQDDAQSSMSTMSRLSGPGQQSADTTLAPQPAGIDNTEEGGNVARESYDDERSGERGAIRPIVVHHLPPLPSFEKTRPAPAPPAQQPAQSSASPATQSKAISTPTSVSVSPIPAPAPAPPISSADILPHPSQNLVKAETMPLLASSGTSGTSPGRGGKEKKSGFGLHWLSNWAKDDDGEVKMSKKEKKNKKERERQSHATQQHASGEKVTEEKESTGFLGSLFGKKKGQDEASKGDQGALGGYGGAHVTAGSLLDMRNKGLVGYYQRYPIHIERAVYRLSHIKLANPRRPLYEQVLISNLMFWYLSVINKSPQQQQQQQQSQEELQSQQLQQQRQQKSQQQRQQEQYQQQEQEQQQQTQVPSSELPGPAAQTMESAQVPAQSIRQDVSGERLQTMPKAVPVDAYQPSPSGIGTEASRSFSSEGNETSNSYAAPAMLTEPASSPDEYGAPSSEATGMVSALTSSFSRGSLAPSGKEKGEGYLSSSSKSSIAKPKRGGLVKPNRAPPGSRSAERAIPGATYGAQHRRLNNEMAASHTPNNKISLGDGYIKSLGLNVVNDHHSDHGVSAPSTSRSTRSSANDEYAWLGSQQRRTISDEWRKDPASARPDDVYQDGLNLFYAQSSVPGEERPMRQSAQDRNVDDHGQGIKSSSIPHSASDERLLLSPQGMDVPSAMLDAARLSQSRRR